MTAVLVSLPTARPSCADDCSERTTLFRPTQKRPTWKDVERDRAVRTAPPPAAPEVTRFFPREGRTPPARLSVVSTLAPPVQLEAFGVQNQEINGRKLCPRCGREGAAFVSLVPGVFTCGPGACNTAGLPDAAPLKFTLRSKWKEWREYR